MIKVVKKSKNNSTFSDYYIGRGSPLGNPFTVEDYGREECIKLYKNYLVKKLREKDPRITEALNRILKIEKETGEVRLVCYCAPLNCHGDFLKDICNLNKDVLNNKGRKVYTGVGARKTPDKELLKIEQISRVLNALGFTLRSGGAIGADSSFEKFSTNKEIYTARDADKECFEIAKRIHPAWDSMGEWGKKLHARNVKQCLGDDLETPASFLVCWTPNGEPVGGTRTAIKCAEENNIPVYNMGKRLSETGGFPFLSFLS